MLLSALPGSTDAVRSGIRIPLLDGAREANNAMRPVVITVFDSEAGTTTEYSFTNSPVRIGRNPLNDLALPFPFVSGWHAVVRFDDDVAKFFDLGSTNGTLLNGRRVQAGDPVVVGEMLSLTIGRLELRFRREAIGFAAAPPPVGMFQPMPGPGGLPATQVAPSASTQQPAMSAPAPHRGHSPSGPLGMGQFAPIGTTNPRQAGPTPPPGSQGTAHVQMSDVHQTVHRLRPAYDAYRQQWSTLLHELDGAMAGMPETLRGFALSILAREFPAISSEPEFEERVRRAGSTTGRATNPGGGGGDLPAVRRMAESLRPGEDPPRSSDEAARFLSCVEDVLRASAKAFVELQKGQEQFGNEMGVRTIKEFTPLHAAGTAENVLKYLLDWQAGGPHRTQELVGVYADLMIHQVALINGVMEGVRSMLARLAPEEIERGVTASWPTKFAATWKKYLERYRALTGEDRKITEIVFGPEFARAYAEVGGEGGQR